MATTTQPPAREGLGPQIIVRTTKRTSLPQPLGWASIFAAAAIAIGATLLLHLIGIGIGLIAIQPDDPSSLRSIGIGTGVWSIVAPIIALFIAGLAVGRTAPTLDSWNAAIHAAATWAISTLAGFVVFAMMLASIARGATSAAAASGATSYTLRVPGGAPDTRSTELALTAAEDTGKVVLVLSIAMLLALLASIVGALISVSRERRDHLRQPA